MLAVSDAPRWGGNTGYEDRPEAFYSWDNKVHNATSVQAGDRVVLRDRVSLLGASVIEEILTEPGEKTWRRCPSCGDRNINQRSTRKPSWRCSATGCRLEFDDPDKGVEQVLTYRARYDAAWTDLHDCLGVDDLKKMTLYGARAPHSIQPIDWERFTARIEPHVSEPGWQSSPVAARTRFIQGGFAQPTTRAVRRGQGAFREALLSEFGEVCAVSGPGPGAALDAAHLYSYAKLGEHLDGGGLLLRSDIHVLFDAGLIAVDPETSCVDVAPGVRDFEAYGQFHGQPLVVKPGPGARRWFHLHWNQHR
jgi:hypothetical protein